TGAFFPTLGVRAAIGRTFDARDGAVAVIGYAAWQRHFGSDPAAIGRTIRVGNVPLTIVGVAERGFFGVAPGFEPDVFVPLAGRRAAADPIFTAATTSSLHLMGRLKGGLTFEQADASLQARWPQVLGPA